MDKIKVFAELIDKAAHDHSAVEQLTLTETFTVEEAYEIQKRSIEHRYERGEKHIGLKMGFTSEAKMKQMGVHDLIWGRLTDSMLYENDSSIPFSDFIHPRVEPEICFRVAKDIDHELSLDEIPDYIDGLAAALEIIDSRYENFKFSLEDVIADNCSSAGLVFGEWKSYQNSIDNLKIDLIINDEWVQEGNSANILNDPRKSLIAATRLAVKFEQEIKAGQYIMAGAATAAVYLKAGDSIKANVEQLGSCGFKVS